MGLIKKIHNDLMNKEYSTRELVASYLKKIKDNDLGTYITVTEEDALLKADAVDGKISAGQTIGLMEGIPMGLKDNLSTKGVRTTCGSKMLENYVPVYSGTVVERLETAGAISLGKCNMDEFAMGSSNETSYYGVVKNPRDLTRVPGGSSGGSAATVAAEEVVFSLGSDTGGSVRQPAGFCGVVGLKPTYGQVSRFGLIAYASSLDQIGPLTQNVEDAALVMETIGGHDPMDSTSFKLPVPEYSKMLTGDVKGLRIGVPKEYFGGDEEVLEGIRKALKVYEDMGAIVEEMSLPHTEYALSAYYIIASAECSSNLARFDGVRYGYRNEESDDVTEMMFKTRGEGFGKEVKKRIMIGTYALSSGYYDAYYLKALKARRLLKEDFDKAFNKYDILVTPIAPTLPFKFGEHQKDPVNMYLGDICTVTINLVGIPGLSIPCGVSKEGLPIGMQLLGKPRDEGVLLNAGSAFERGSK